MSGRHHRGKTKTALSTNTTENGPVCESLALLLTLVFKHVQTQADETFFPTSWRNTSSFYCFCVLLELMKTVSCFMDSIVVRVSAFFHILFGGVLVVIVFFPQRLQSTLVLAYGICVCEFMCFCCQRYLKKMLSDLCNTRNSVVQDNLQSRTLRFVGIQVTHKKNCL